MITIWGGATSRTIRPHWMLHELGVDYEPKLIGSRSGATQDAAFVKLNVKEKIPVLVDDDLVLTESAAIVTYLGDTYGPESGLVPKPYTTARAKYNEWSSYIQMELDAHTLYVIRKHRDLADLYGEAPAAIDAAIEGFQKQLRFAEQGLDGRNYLLGDTFTAADILLTSCLAWANAYDVEISDSLQAYTDRNTARDAFKQAAKLNFSISPGG